MILMSHLTKQILSRVGGITSEILRIFFATYKMRFKYETIDHAFIHAAPPKLFALASKALLLLCCGMNFFSSLARVCKLAQSRVKQGSLAFV